MSPVVKPGGEVGVTRSDDQPVGSSKSPSGVSRVASVSRLNVARRLVEELNPRSLGTVVSFELINVLRFDDEFPEECVSSH